MSSGRVPGLASSANCTSTCISRVIINGSPLVSSSMVAATPPSTEFSIGTTAPSASDARTVSSATVTVLQGNSSAFAAAGSERRAASVNVPSGPR
jgi:hypothetical protein